MLSQIRDYLETSGSISDFLHLSNSTRLTDQHTKTIASMMDLWKCRSVSETVLWGRATTVYHSDTDSDL